MIPSSAASGGSAPITAAGTLSNTSGSASTVTGTSRALTVPGNNSGNIRFESVSNEGGGNVQYSKNGGAFTTLASNDVVNFADTDTLQMRATGLGTGQSGYATLKDVTTGRTIENVTLTKAT